MPDPSPTAFGRLAAWWIGPQGHARSDPHRGTLDGLRFLAFLAVFYFHAQPDRCPWGGGGVRVFFTLSGFLITRILVRDETSHRGADLKRFYIRRTLRIFPLYYALVLAFWLGGGLTHTAWFLGYLANVEAYLSGGFDTTLGHFWTLSVEEQFYLVFPPVFWLTPPRGRVALILGVIAGSIAFQVWAHATGRMPLAKWLTPYCASDLAWGALAGMIELRTRPRWGVATALVLLGCGLLVVAWWLDQGRFGFGPRRQLDLAPTAAGMGAACLVCGLWRTTNPLWTWTLANAPIAYLGRISYGLYAFHLPVIRGYLQPVEVPFAFLIPEVIRKLLITTLWAAASWRFFEGPINRLKERAGPRRPHDLAEHRHRRTNRKTPGNHRERG